MLRSLTLEKKLFFGNVSSSHRTVSSLESCLIGILFCSLRFEGVTEFMWTCSWTIRLRKRLLLSSSHKNFSWAFRSVAFSINKQLEIKRNVYNISECLIYSTTLKLNERDDAPLLSFHVSCDFRFKCQIPASSAEPFVHHQCRVGVYAKMKLWYLEIC